MADLGAFRDTPEFIPFDAGADVVLRHQSGAEYSGTSTPRGLETPILWDGSWEVLRGGVVVATFSVGPAELGDGSFAGCIPKSPPFTVAPDPIACLQSAALRSGARPYADAHAELDEVLAGLERVAPNGPANWYCFLAGEAIAAAAVLNGADLAAMFTGHSSHCSFSLLHGAYAAKVRPGTDLRAVCDHRAEYALEEDEHTSQCWNGIGIGLARLHRFDEHRIVEACQEAPGVGALKNCFEGALNHFRNYRLRLPAGSWGPPQVDPRWCASRRGDVSTSADFQEACYRAATNVFLERTAAPMEPAERFVAVCASLTDPGRQGCMGAAGSLAGRLVLHYKHPLGVVPAAVDVCGTVTRFDEGCLVRLFSTLLRTPQNRSGFTEEELLPLVPQAHLAAIAGHFERWQVSISGIGELPPG